MANTNVPGWASLGPDEEVAWFGRPSPYLQRKWLLIAAGVGLLGVAGYFVLPPRIQVLGLAGIAGGVALGVAAAVLYRSVNYLVTSEKVYRKRGLVRRSVDTVRLDRIQNVRFQQTFFQRLISCGDVFIETAGTGGTELVLRSVYHPEEVNSLLLDREARTADREGPGGSGTSGTAPDDRSTGAGQ
ncbi:PH domain-containing protein [Halobacteriaceae archaeon GCM10025711]